MEYSWQNKTKEDYQGSFEKYTHDENGNLIYQEDDKGNFSKWEYDENGNLIYEEGCDETNSIGDYWKEYIVLEI